MPNWSYNHLNITGKARELKRFLTDGLYGYEPVYNPIHAFEIEVNDKSESPQLTRTMNVIAPVPQDVLTKGYSDAGYQWQCDHWGTKWDFCDMTDDGTEEKLKIAKDDEIISLTYHYSTAWSPNKTWVIEAAKRFPTLLFDLSYEEEAGFFAGRFVIKASREILRRDYTDMIVYHLMEGGRELRDIIEDCYYFHEEDKLSNLLECVLKKFENAFALGIVTEKVVRNLTTEVWKVLSDQEGIA